MPNNRRQVLAFGAAAVVSTVTAASGRSAISLSPSLATLGIDGAEFGLRAGSDADQSRQLQRAIDEAAARRVPLLLKPGVYRASRLRLASGAALAGVREATRLVLSDGPGLIESANADGVSLSGLVLDGAKRPLPQGRGLLHVENARALKISDCDIRDSGGDGMHLIASDGEIVDNVITGAADCALHSLDARGLFIGRNRIQAAGNNGIQVWRSDPGDDGSIVTDNRIEDIANRSGGSGQYGNAINVFRAGNVIVRGNRIQGCAFSAVRGNAASNIHIESNAVSTIGEVALYSEFGFEGAIIAGNTVDGAAIGISVTNFNEGGRLAVVSGNLLRNLLPRRPAGTDPGDNAGIGIAAEADTAITGNVVENAPFAGIVLGYGRYLRDVKASGNIVRKADIGIAVSVTPGAGSALIDGNLIAEAMRGAIIGMDQRRIVTGDLMKGGAERYPQLTLANNRVR